MGQMIILLCPEGAAENAPPSHGGTAYYPFPLVNHPQYPTRNGGPYGLRVPLEIYHHFIGRPGYMIYDDGG